MDQLRLAKNKDAVVLFRSGNQTLELEVMAEVVSQKGNVRFPALGEVTNAVAIKLSEDKETAVSADA